MIFMAVDPLPATLNPPCAKGGPGGIAWLVKLGGSLAASPHLPLWLEALSQTAAVIVPGGGPFADAVREAQARWHFDETTAHHMAILGMRQYGRMLAGLCPKLRAATTLEELTANPGQAKVWLPLPEWLDDAGIPATWDITSDSLAAWLAGQTQAANLLLVKSVRLDKAAPAYDCRQLANQGWVDPVFPEYAAKGRFQSWLCGPEAYQNLDRALASPENGFLHIAPISPAI